MIIKSGVTMDSPLAVREMLKMLARAAAERDDDATRSAERLERFGDTPGRPEPVAWRERLVTETLVTRARAATARYLLIEAWVRAGLDAEGRYWISRDQAEKLADAMIKVALLNRKLPELTAGLDLDDIFTGEIEVPDERR